MSLSIPSDIITSGPFPVVNINTLPHTLCSGEQFRGQMFLAITSGGDVLQMFGPGTELDPKLAVEHIRLSLQRATIQRALASTEQEQRLRDVSIEQEGRRLAAAEKLVAGGVSPYDAAVLSVRTALYGTEYDPKFYAAA